MEALRKQNEKLKSLIANIELQNSIEDPSTEAEIFRLELLARDAIKLRSEISALDKQIAEGKEIPAGAEAERRKLIKTIHIDEANFEHIRKYGQAHGINGTLLVEIERVMESYASIRVKEALQSNND